MIDAQRSSYHTLIITALDKSSIHLSKQLTSTLFKTYSKPGVELMPIISFQEAKAKGLLWVQAQIGERPCFNRHIHTTPTQWQLAKSMRKTATIKFLCISKFLRLKLNHKQKLFFLWKIYPKLSKTSRAHY